MKKILSLIIALAMLLTSNLAFAQYEAITGIETLDDSIVVSGQNISKKDSVITIQVLKDGATWNDLDSFDYSTGDITNYLKDFDAISGIGYGEDYSFTLAQTDGAMPVFRIRFGDGTITYYDPALMESINAAASPEELEEIAKGNAAVWNDMQGTVDALSDDEEAAFWQILFNTKEALKAEEKPFAFPSEFSAAAPGVSALARMSVAADASALEELFDDFKAENLFIGNSYDIYAGIGEFAEYGMSDSQKEAFFKYIYSNVDEYAYIEDFTSDFNENVVFYAIKGGAKGFIDAIISNSDLIDPDEIPTYFELSSINKKYNVCEIIGTNKRYSSISTLLDAIESKAKSEKRGKQESLGGGGGGGAGTEIKGEPFVSVVEEDEAKVEGLPFTDIENVEWAQEAITALAGKNIVSGDGNGTFRPSDFVTREEFVKMLVLTLNITVSSASENFDDIDSSDWCHPYVAAAISAGIVNGINANTFGKGRVITREEMATMTYRAISAVGMILGGADKAGFADEESISSWAAEACTAMHKAGIVNGMGNNHFAPKENVTRAQAAKILYEVMKR